jgi:hypothetical protein
MDYLRMQSMASRLLDGAAQGEISTVAQVVSVPGATPLDAPTVTRTYELTSGVARGVSSKYVDGETILATDLQLVLRHDAEVKVGDIIKIDNVNRAVVRLENIPASGIVCAKRVFVR